MDRRTGWRLRALTLPLALTLPSVAGGPEAVAPGDARVVVVDLWATWCAPCARALPELEALAEELGPRGVSVVAVAQDSDPSVVASFVLRLGLERVRVLVDSEHRLAQALDPPTLPTTYVFGPNGLVARFVGWRSGQATELRTAVLRELGDPAPGAERSLPPWSWGRLATPAMQMESGGLELGRRIHMQSVREGGALTTGAGGVQCGCN